MNVYEQMWFIYVCICKTFRLCMHAIAVVVPNGEMSSKDLTY